jgi:hypothetical protein
VVNTVVRRAALLIFARILLVSRMQDHAKEELALSAKLYGTKAAGESK